MKKKDEIVLAPEQEVSIDDFYEDKGVTAIKDAFEDYRRYRSDLYLMA